MAVHFQTRSQTSIQKIRTTTTQIQILNLEIQVRIQVSNQIIHMVKTRIGRDQDKTTIREALRTITTKEETTRTPPTIMTIKTITPNKISTTKATIMVTVIINKSSRITK